MAGLTGPGPGGSGWSKASATTTGLQVIFQLLPPTTQVRDNKLLQAECAVCLKDFDAEDKLRAMPCVHAFHDQCIFQWPRLNATCPLVATRFLQPRTSRRTKKLVPTIATHRRRRIPRSVSSVYHNCNFIEGDDLSVAGLKVDFFFHFVLLCAILPFMLGGQHGAATSSEHCSSSSQCWRKANVCCEFYL
jgi:hypothetical protein